MLALNHYEKGATMTAERALRPQERIAARVARVVELVARGYSKTEIAEMLGVQRNTIAQDLRRLERRVPAEDAKQWRQIQLLRYERLLEACQAVLSAHHIAVSNGRVVTQYVFGEDGKPIWDPVWLPDGTQRHDDDGNPVVVQRTQPVEDSAPILEAVAEMRKIEDAIAKLLGTPVPVKQLAELQHVAYAIEGVDMTKVLGTPQE